MDVREQITVKRGQSWDTVAAQVGKKPQQLMKENPQVGNTLIAGTVLRNPTSRHGHSNTMEVGIGAENVASQWMSSQNSVPSWNNQTAPMPNMIGAPETSERRHFAGQGPGHNRPVHEVRKPESWLGTIGTNLIPQGMGAGTGINPTPQPNSVGTGALGAAVTAITPSIARTHLYDPTKVSQYEGDKPAMMIAQERIRKNQGSFAPDYLAAQQYMGYGSPSFGSQTEPLTMSWWLKQFGLSGGGNWGGGWGGGGGGGWSSWGSGGGGRSQQQPVAWSIR
jgi:LysM repeat protein